MNSYEKRLILILVFLIMSYFLFKDKTIVLTPGVKIQTAPKQKNLSTQEKFIYKGAMLTKIASISLNAKILSKKYYSDKDSDFAPVDLALGWGFMSDENLIHQFDISQSGRWFRWHIKDPKTFAYTIEDVVKNSANMHIIPVTNEIKNKIAQVTKGDIINLQGYLINLEKPNGGNWKSSISRTDSGNGACELVWVESFDIITNEYY